MRPFPQIRPVLKEPHPCDLGPKNLDVFIGAVDGRGISFSTVSDGARLGSDLLLRKIAEQPQGMLPADGNWGCDPEEIESKLHAWMRSEGSPRLFGTDACGRPELRLWGLRGFQHAASGALARKLLSRYFRFLVEFISRQLVADLVVEWFPRVREADYESISTSIQLRGEGWKLRYQDEDAAQGASAIRDMIRQRSEELWTTVRPNPYPFLGEDGHWANANYYSQSEMTTNAVGKAMSFKEAKGRCHRCPLIDLEGIQPDGSRFEINWFDRLPISAGGSSHIHLKDLSPPIVLSSPYQDELVKIGELEAWWLGRINSALRDEGVGPMAGSYQAPIAAIVWEAIFESPHFWPDPTE